MYPCYHLPDIINKNIFKEKVSFHSNPKEGKCQRMFKLLHNCTHLTHYQSNAQNSPNEASTVCEPWISRYLSWTSKKQRNQREIKLPTFIGSSKKQESSRKSPTYALLTMPKPLTVQITTNWKILKEMGITNHLTCLLRNLYAGQEATVKTGLVTIDWFQIGKQSRMYIFTLHI